MENEIITSVIFEGNNYITVKGKTNIGNIVSLFKYYPDELSFTSKELVGLTVNKAHDLFHRKDIAYLQSNSNGAIR